MILADTSIWIQHFRHSDPHFQQLLVNRRVLMHDFVLGEIACGNLHARSKVLGDLRRLPLAVSAQHDEVLVLLEQHRLFAKGVTWIDLHLLASARLTGCRLWTLDQSLRDLADGLKVGYLALQ